MPGAWRYRVSAGAGGSGVSMLRLGEVESWIYNFYFMYNCLSRSVPEIHWYVDETLSKQPTSNRSDIFACCHTAVYVVLTRLVCFWRDLSVPAEHTSAGSALHSSLNNSNSNNSNNNNNSNKIASATTAATRTLATAAATTTTVAAATTTAATATAMTATAATITKAAAATTATAEGTTVAAAHQQQQPQQQQQQQQQRKGA